MTNRQAITGTWDQFRAEAKRRGLRINVQQKRAFDDRLNEFRWVGFEEHRLRGVNFTGHEHWGDPDYTMPRRFAMELASRIR